MAFSWTENLIGKATGQTPDVPTVRIIVHQLNPRIFKLNRTYHDICEKKSSRRINVSNDAKNSSACMIFGSVFRLTLLSRTMLKFCAHFLL